MYNDKRYVYIYQNNYISNIMITQCNVIRWYWKTEKISNLLLNLWKNGAVIDHKGVEVWEFLPAQRQTTRVCNVGGLSIKTINS